MGRRLKLQSLLEALLGSRNVYFRPPESVKLNYPCIIYARDLGNTKFADNSPYMFCLRYQLIIIDQDPDSEIPEKVALLPRCLFERHYVADNLNHDVYNI